MLLGYDMDLVLATNGVNMTKELAAAMAMFKPRVWVSMHRPEKAGPAVEMLKAVGILAGVSADPTIAATNWAGQVKWHVSASERSCNWIRNGWVMAMSDGRITTCSFDGTGDSGVIGTVLDDPSKLVTAPYNLCHGCDQIIGVAGYDQR